MKPDGGGFENPPITLLGDNTKTSGALIRKRVDTSVDPYKEGGTRGHVPGTRTSIWRVKIVKTAKGS